MNEEYFGFIIGDFRELLKGAIKKSFFLKNTDEELIRTVSDNFVLYHKKSLEIKQCLNASNTKASYIGKGKVQLL